MRLTWEPLTLRLASAFNIAHGSYTERHNVLVRLDAGDVVGLGEAAVVPYLGESRAGVVALLEEAARGLGDDAWLVEDILDALPPGSAAARGAIASALYDILGQRLSQPLWRVWGLNPARAPLTSVTIGIDTPAAMAAQAQALNAPILKVKLGGPDDLALVRAIRGVTNAVIRVDANAGWSRETAAALIPRLADLGVEFVEQPLAADDTDGLRWLRGRSPLPLFADEAVRSTSDVARLAGAVDGVVVKLAKFGGIREARRAIDLAHALDMRVMLSCMVESTLGVSAAAHLAPLCEVADLDGPLLIANDPFQGMAYDGARLVLPTGPGLGVRQVL
ncbi:MAG: dipeptide epimerase [Anaerolineae bacterium]